MVESATITNFGKTRRPLPTAEKIADRSAQHVNPNEIFSTLHPAWIAPWSSSRAAPTLKPEYGAYAISRTAHAASISFSSTDTALHFAWSPLVFNTAPLSTQHARSQVLTHYHCQIPLNENFLFISPSVDVYVEPRPRMQTLTAPSQFADAEINRGLSNEQKIGFLREMFRIRRFEQVALKYYNQGKMGGFLHLYIGQESVAVGTMSLLGENDHVITAYRDHGHALAVGMGMNECMAELFGKATGCSKGKGGSMHFFAPDKNYWGGHGIVGGPDAARPRPRLRAEIQGPEGRCLCFLGDGAVNQGAFHESLNMASLFDLPVIYIIENNGYSMGTSLERSSAFTELPGRSAPKATTSSGMCQRRGSSTRCAPRPRSRSSGRTRNRGPPCSKSTPTATTATPSPTRTPRSTAPPEEIETLQDEPRPHPALADSSLIQRRRHRRGSRRESARSPMRNARRKQPLNFAEESPFPDRGRSFCKDVYWRSTSRPRPAATGQHFFQLSPDPTPCR